MSAKKSRFKTPPEPSERKEAERKEKARVRMALWRESKKEEAARQRETMMDSAMQRLSAGARDVILRLSANERTELSERMTKAKYFNGTMDARLLAQVMESFAGVVAGRMLRDVGNQAVGAALPFANISALAMEQVAQRAATINITPASYGLADALPRELFGRFASPVEPDFYFQPGVLNALRLDTIAIGATSFTVSKINNQQLRFTRQSDGKQYTVPITIGSNGRPGFIMPKEASLQYSPPEPEMVREPGSVNDLHYGRWLRSERQSYTGFARNKYPTPRGTYVIDTNAGFLDMLPTGRLSGRIEATAYVTPKSPLLVEQLEFTLRWPPRSPQNEMARLQRWLQMVVYQSARHFTGKRGLHSTGFRLLLPKDVQS